MATTWKRWRGELLVLGYFFSFAVIAVHVGLWLRANMLGAYWGHFDQAAIWMHVIDTLSLLSLTFFLFARALTIARFQLSFYLFSPMLWILGRTPIA
jgi:hypothetical protein